MCGKKARKEFKTRTYKAGVCGTRILELLTTQIASEAPFLNLEIASLKLHDIRLGLGEYLAKASTAKPP